ncbi:MAG: hypothetical protein HRU03_05445, partial [Nanoarchaeales archaeon]|nr:hypothetical protein [Nanoarchaeales archaeon]
MINDTNISNLVNMTLENSTGILNSSLNETINTSISNDLFQVLQNTLTNTTLLQIGLENTIKNNLYIFIIPILLLLIWFLKTFIWAKKPLNLKTHDK